MLTEEAIWERLMHDTAYYAKHCVRIVDKSMNVVALEPRPAQLKLDAALEKQRLEGRPERAIVLKSRQTGISTWVQIKLLQRTTLRANRKALVVAHDNDTAGELFSIGKTGYAHLPNNDPRLKPGLVQNRDSVGGTKLMHFGQVGRVARAQGDVGINSRLQIDTAKEAAAGRGKTFSDLHCSEVAFWPDPNKALSLLNALADMPGTLGVLESTANGNNFFKKRWDRAEAGQSDYAPVFIGWTEDPDCTRAFRSDEARAAFIETIGEGEYGEDEPRLIERFDATPEQLHWRRFAIVDKCDGDLNKFKQEYPSSPGEAFMRSGNHVFPFAYIQNVLDLVESTDPPAVGLGKRAQPGDGLLMPAALKRRTVRDGEVEVPTGTLWVPQSATGFTDKADLWRVWEHPLRPSELDADELAKLQGDSDIAVQPGQYIISCDVAGGEEETSTGETAFHAIEVINHHTLQQCAEYHTRCDPDLLPLQLMLAGLHYNEATIVVETTGGWGTPVVMALWKRLGYRRLYRRRQIGTAETREQDLLGWDTNRRTKPLLIAGMTELLREGTHGIRGKALAGELTSFVKDTRGRSGPDADSFSDRLMAFMIGQYVAAEHRPRPPKRQRAQQWKPRNPVTGY